jgi:restriction system protein
MNADLVLVFLAPEKHYEHAFVERDIPVAIDIERLKGRDFILPVRLEPLALPTILRHREYLDLFDDSEYPSLLSALRRILNPRDMNDAIREFEFPGLVDAQGLPLTTASRNRSRLILDVKNLNSSILSDLSVHPSRFYELSPYQFEEVVADLLSGQGYSVTRTPSSHDGGFDMYAAKKDGLGEFLYLVECKRYSPSHRVGVDVVRSLRGVLSDRRATGAALVTTSFFTRGARAIQQTNEHRLKLHDYAILLEWLTRWRNGTA